MSTIGQWQLLVLAAATVVNLLVAYRIHRLGQQGFEAGAGATADGDRSREGDPVFEDGRVACPACGVENETGYRFCRDCLSELPGAARFDRESTDPLGGLTR